MSFWVAGHITGGLGNRLFQHVSAMGLAEQWGYKPVFYLPMVEETNHGPYENIFKLFPSIPVVSDRSPYYKIAEPNGHVFTHTGFQESPIAQNIVIDGWRQSEKYFPKGGIQVAIEDVIKNERKEFLLQKYGLEKNKESICFIHIRMGDYKILPHHQIDIGTYCARASKHFEPNTRFLVFSDEAQTHKAMLEEFVKALGHQGVVVEESDELENLYLMSQCGGGAIVCNSTFSWWGAYLARQRCLNPNTYKACYPGVWGAGLPPARDVVPVWGITIQL